MTVVSQRVLMMIVKMSTRTSTVLRTLMVTQDSVISCDSDSARGTAPVALSALRRKDVLSYISKCKTTPSRSSLHLDGSLSSIMVLKTHISDSLNGNLQKKCVVKAKGATRQ